MKIPLHSSRRFARLRQIERLDPDSDFEEIFRLITDYEFPWDYRQSVSLAFFRTFGIPSIGNMLDETGEIVHHTQKRADDTLLILYEISQRGLETPEGRTYLRRMNQMHRRYRISNDDSLYIIALYIVVPVRWINQYGWRHLTAREERALTTYGKRLAHLMGIKDIPSSFTEFAQFAQLYEDQHFACTDSSRRLAVAALDICADMLPRPMRRPLKPLMRRFSLAALDDPVLLAVGQPIPSDRDRRAATSVLRLRGRILRVFPPRPEGRPHRLALATYPHGYDVTDVGPDWMRTASVVGRCRRGESD
jgi:ER-bound oxygenase mpaB/B'/Rubber oxygenase, catalytic domain